MMTATTENQRLIFSPKLERTFQNLTRTRSASSASPSIDLDYTTRAEPSDILEALDKLR